jgi:hypothetical protein
MTKQIAASHIKPFTSNRPAATAKANPNTSPTRATRLRQRSLFDKGASTGSRPVMLSTPGVSEEPPSTTAVSQLATFHPSRRKVGITGSAV